MAPHLRPGSPDHLAALDALWEEAEARAENEAQVEIDAPATPRPIEAAAGVPGLVRAIVLDLTGWQPAPEAHRLALFMAAAVFVTGMTAALTFDHPPLGVDTVANGTSFGLVADAMSRDASLAVPAEAALASIEPAPVEPPVPEVVPTVPKAGSLPAGKGMWIWKPEYTEGGDPHAIVERAEAVGLTHLYVRTGSSVQGFHGAAFLDRILPVAHAAGIRVYGWDFPYFTDVQSDIDRAMQAITHRTPDGHSIDGFVPDIETPSEGTRLTAENAAAYGRGLRAAVGDEYPLIVCVPRPSSVMTGGRYPYDVVVEPYDAIIPMVYWLNRQPDTDVAGAIDWLSRFGKPVIPVGQAYDGQFEGGRPGPPPADEIQRFLSTAEAHGATGVSFWSWQHATDEIWVTYAAAPEFTRAPVPEDPAHPELDETELRDLQALLASLGHPVPITGVWDPATVEALRAAQRDLGLEVTGLLDGATQEKLRRQARGLLDLEG